MKHIPRIFNFDWFPGRDESFVIDNKDKVISAGKAEHGLCEYIYSPYKMTNIISSNALIARELNNLRAAVGTKAPVKVTEGTADSTAYTDGKIICVTKTLAKGTKNDYAAMDQLIGATLHECCHCLWTDFELMLKIIEKDGVNYLVKTLQNVLEDEMIERKMCLKYPGYGRYIGVLKMHNLYNSRFAERLIKFEKTPEQFFEMFLSVIRVPGLVKEYSDEVLEGWEEMFEEVKKILLRHGITDTKNEKITQSCFAAANEIAKLLAEEFNNEKEDFAGEGSGEGSSSASGMLGTGKGSDEGESSASGSEEMTEETLKDVLKKLSEAIKDTLDEINKASDATESSSDARDKVEKSDIEHSVTKHSERADKEYDTEAAEKGIDTIDNGKYSSYNLDDLVDMISSEQADADSSKFKIKDIDETASGKIRYDKAKKEIEPYLKQIKDIFKVRNFSQVINTREGLRSGNLSPMRMAEAMQNVQNVYQRKSIQNIRKESDSFAFTIIMDNSGSMTGNYDKLMQLTTLLYEAMRINSGTELYVYGHTDTIYRYVCSKNNKSGVAVKSIGTMPELGSSGQDDAAAYKMIIEDVKQQTKLPIICLTITDCLYMCDHALLREFIKRLKIYSMCCLNINNYTSPEENNAVNDDIFGKKNHWLLNGDINAETIGNLALKISKRFKEIMREKH